MYQYCFLVGIILNDDQSIATLNEDELPQNYSRHGDELLANAFLNVHQFMTEQPSLQNLESQRNGLSESSQIGSIIKMHSHNDLLIQAQSIKSESSHLYRMIQFSMRIQDQIFFPGYNLLATKKTLNVFQQLASINRIHGMKHSPEQKATSSLKCSILPQTEDSIQLESEKIQKPLMLSNLDGSGQQYLQERIEKDRKPIDKKTEIEKNLDSERVVTNVTLQIGGKIAYKLRQIRGYIQERFSNIRPF
ncbi:hypothetical protein FGO68_gene13871 [Halteria grandinella]|uniref:Uncharacterized protein n=1 Tax=Halteria grandinella TaxID=5974 RepID=A0A8J8NXG7_HALGN|nr:hypothetical protein FGO68_gene13871 [Halteria grandinella]